MRAGRHGLGDQSHHGSQHSGYVYGDSGTPDKVGESSQKLHDALGNPNGLVTFIAFPDSGHGKIVGKSPAMRIRIDVLNNMMKLGANADELAQRLAMGKKN